MTTEIATADGDAELEAFEASVVAEQELERGVLHTIVRCMLISFPVMVAVFLLILGLAVGDHTDWYVWVLVALLMGAIGAVLSGMIMGMTIAAPALEHVDHDAA